MSASRASHDLAEISRRILAPLATGQTIEIGAPFGPKRALAAAALVSEATSLSEARLMQNESRELDLAEAYVVQRIQRLCAVDSGCFHQLLEPSIVQLGALFHDLLCAFHPAHQALLRRSSQPYLLALTLEGLAAIDPPRTVASLLLREGWLGGFFEAVIRRTDVRWWTGHASFLGQDPPKRLLAWRRARKVQEQTQAVSILRLPEVSLGEPRVQAAYAEPYFAALMRLFEKSPLTDLRLSGRAEPAFAWHEGLSALVVHPVCQRLARRALRLGPDGGRSALEAVGLVAPERYYKLLTSEVPVATGDA